MSGGLGDYGSIDRMPVVLPVVLPIFLIVLYVYRDVQVSMEATERPGIAKVHMEVIFLALWNRERESVNITRAAKICKPRTERVSAASSLLFNLIS